MATKVISIAWTETSVSIYCIIRQQINSYRFDNGNGTFVSTPINPYLFLIEDAVIKGLYEISESRTVWADGVYIVIVYKQKGLTPSPSVDIVIGAEEMFISADTEVKAIETKIDVIDGIVDDIKTEVLTHPTLAEIEATIVLAKQATLVLVQDAVYAGKWVIDPTGKVLTLYKADGITVLKIIDLTSTTAVIPTFIQGVPRA